MEELLAPGVLLLAVGNSIVGLECLLEVLRSAANLLGELLTSDLLHEATARVVASVEVQDVGGLGVENEADGELALVLLLPHHAGDVITVAELVAESVTVAVEKETTLTTQGLSGQELPLVAGVLGVDETSGVDLDLVHVDTVTTDSHDHLLTITSGVGAVGGSKAHELRAVLLEQRTIAKVGGVTTGGEDDGAIHAGGLAVHLIGDTSDLVALLVQAGNAGLLDDLNAVGLGLGKLLDALHQSVGDGHTGEFGIVASVGSGLGVTTGNRVVSRIDPQNQSNQNKPWEQNLPKSGDERQVEVEHILQPLNGSSGLVGEDLDEIRASLVTSRLEGIVVELLDAVADVVVDLGAGQGTVDTGGSLGRVTTEETWSRKVSISYRFCWSLSRFLRCEDWPRIALFRMVLTLLVENHNVATGKVDGVGGRQTRNCNGERQQTDGQTRISSRCRASARLVREGEKEQRHKEQAGDDAIWGYLRPPPTTITLGAIIVTCGSFEGVDEGRKKDGAQRRRKGGYTDGWREKEENGE